MEKIIEKKQSGSIYENPQHKRLRIFSTFIAIFFAFVCALFLVFCFTHSMKIVEGESMQPTINKDYQRVGGKDKNCDYVIYSKVQTPKRGDIVIINLASSKTDIIKRVIATEGDTLNISWNAEAQKLVVTLTKKGETQAEVLTENYIKKDANDSSKDDLLAKKCAVSFQAKTGWENKEECDVQPDGSITIPKNCFFALGDNRGNSNDCADFGPLQNSSVVGVVETLIPSGSFIHSALTFLFSLQ